jgi:predicted RNA binding protein YcfA (HicA-like mRNA interferase family)
MLADVLASQEVARDRRRAALEELEQNPKAVRPQVLERCLRAFGYEVKRQTGSHRVYGKPGAYPLSVPFRRPHIKQAYIDQVIARFREELGEEGGERLDGSD